MNVLEAIKTRRTIREFENKEISDEQINTVLEAGQWAPSGLNNQPWKFKVIKDQETKAKVAEHTKYGSIIQKAPASIAVFFDNNQGYNRTKDIQSMGACIQNMLLAIHGLGLGGVWLGEILNQREAVEKTLGVPEGCELMAVLAFGHPSVKGASSRKGLDELLL